MVETIATSIDTSARGYRLVRFPPQAAGSIDNDARDVRSDSSVCAEARSEFDQPLARLASDAKFPGLDLALIGSPELQTADDILTTEAVHLYVDPGGHLENDDSTLATAVQREA